MWEFRGLVELIRKNHDVESKSYGFTVIAHRRRELEKKNDLVRRGEVKGGN